jgi:hypothetical protein
MMQCPGVCAIASLLSLIATIVTASPHFGPSKIIRQTVNYAPKYHLDADGRRTETRRAKQTIRIKPIFLENLIQGSSTKKQYMKTVFNEAVTYLQSALKVTPAVGPLFFQADCQQYVAAGSSYCKSSHLKLQCGIVETVPANHTADYNVCPYSGGNPAGACYSNNETGAMGVPNADVAVYVTMNHSASCGTQATSGSVAFGGECRSDQNDRPIFGFVNFCPDMMTDGTAATGHSAQKHKMQLNTAVHEITHVLGFNTIKYAYWRKQDGTPQTTRDAQGKPNLGTMDFYGITIDKPSTNTMAERTERGGTVYELVTPSVLKQAKWQLGCDSITGVELENQGGAGTGGAHFESRLFLNDIMAAFENPVSIRTALDLAVLQDTGYYEADLCKGEPVETFTNKALGGSVWGANQGCTFAKEKCMTAGNPPTAKTGVTAWCAQQSPGLDFGCDFTGKAFGYCTAGDQTAGWNKWPTDLPSIFRYWTSDAKIGSEMKYTDYCPFVRQSQNGLCTDGSLKDTTQAGQIYGADSRCFASSLAAIGVGTVNSKNAGCHPWQCTASGLLQIKVGTSFNSWLDCPTNGGAATALGYTGTIICPAWKDLCDITNQPAAMAAPGCTAAAVDSRVPTAGNVHRPPASCPKATNGKICAGNGDCPQGINICYCQLGKSGTTCESDPAEITVTSEVELQLACTEIQFGNGQSLKNALNALKLVNANIQLISSRVALTSASRRTTGETMIAKLNLGSNAAVTSLEVLFDASDVRLHTLPIAGQKVAILKMRLVQKGKTNTLPLPENTCTTAEGCCATADSPATMGFLKGAKVVMNQDACLSHCKSDQKDDFFRKYKCCVKKLGETEEGKCTVQRILFRIG